MENLQEAERPESPCAISQNVMFPREFRWTFHSELCAELTNYTQETSVNLVQKTLKVKVMEVVLHDAYNPALEFVRNWIQHDLNSVENADTLTMRFYDGCGNLLTQSKFFSPKLVNHSYSTDYSKSDVLNHHLTFEFATFESECPVEKEKPISMGIGAIGGVDKNSKEHFVEAKKVTLENFAKAAKSAKKKNSRKN